MDNSVGQGSFSFDGSHWTGRGGSGSSNNSGGIPPDPRTAAQLLKLQRLVESLVVRELERGDAAATGLPRSATDLPSRAQPRPHPHARGTAHSHGGAPGGSGGGAGGHADGGGRSRHPSPYSHYSNDSSQQSLDSGFLYGVGGVAASAEALGLGAGGGGSMGRPNGSSGGGGRSSARGRPGVHRGAGLPGSASPLEAGMQLQADALQAQLALLSEQLNAVYRAAAEGAVAGTASSPSAAAAAAAAAGGGFAPAAGGGGGSLPRGQAAFPHGQGHGHGMAMAHGSAGSADVATPSGFGGGMPQSPYRASNPVRPLSPHPHPHTHPQHHPEVPASTSSAYTRAADVLGPDPGGGAGGFGGGVGTGAGTFPPPGTGGSSGAGSGSSGPHSSQQQQQRGLRQAAAPVAAVERAAREAGAREDERLRIWIQELRSERRRLEDRLLEGDGSVAGAAAGAQQMRDELEKQVLLLYRQRDQLSSELDELAATRATHAQLGAKVEALELALAAEGDRVARYKEVRPLLEGRLAEVVASLESLRLQHGAAMEAAGRERDAAAAKAKRSSKRASELEAALGSARADVRRLEDEVRSHVVSLAELRASSEVLQSASQQLQAAMEAQARESATRLANVQSQLEASQSECVISRRQLDGLQREATALREQLQDAQSRLEAASSDKSRLVASLVAEQRATVAARQQAESLAAQLQAVEEARADAARAAAAQLEAVQRQHEADMVATQKQYESQLSVAERQYLLLQRQYDAGLASSDVAAEAAAGLRRERDALWAETQNLKAELEEARSERADAASKLSSLRAELRSTVEEVVRDRDAKLAAAASQHEVALREARAEGERRAAALRQEHEAKATHLMDVAEKLRGEALEAGRQADKYRNAAGHLKDQVRDLLLSRDAAERELATERSFNTELNRILASLREEQQQEALRGQLGGSGTQTATTR